MKTNQATKIFVATFVIATVVIAFGLIGKCLYDTYASDKQTYRSQDGTEIELNFKTNTAEITVPRKFLGIKYLASGKMKIYNVSNGIAKTFVLVSRDFIETKAQIYCGRLYIQKRVYYKINN